MTGLQNGELQNGEPAWLTKVLRKRKIQAAALQPYILQKAGQTDESITAVDDAEELVDRIANGELTAYDVVSAYVRK